MHAHFCQGSVLHLCSVLKKTRLHQFLELLMISVRGRLSHSDEWALQGETGRTHAHVNFLSRRLQWEVLSDNETLSCLQRY